MRQRFVAAAVLAFFLSSSAVVLAQPTGYNGKPGPENHGWVQAMIDHLAEHSCRAAQAFAAAMGVKTKACFTEGPKEPPKEDPKDPIEKDPIEKEKKG